MTATGKTAGKTAGKIAGRGNAGPTDQDAMSQDMASHDKPGQPGARERQRKRGGENATPNVLSGNKADQDAMASGAVFLLFSISLFTAVT